MNDKKQLLNEGLQGASKIKPAQMISKPTGKELQNGLGGAEKLMAPQKPQPKPQPQPSDKKGE
jgi:hypothetical protein